MSFLTDILREARLLAGIEQNTTSHWEKLLSALGALLGITGVYWASLMYLGGPSAALLMVASMGASAVLLFAVPHGALSQPWPVAGGHMLSALIGVVCYQLFTEAVWMPALAVGLAVGAMYYFRCIHPPGGATALTAAIGGDAIQSLGFGYLIFPVAINVMSILAVAVIFNAPFQWRRYPARLANWRKEQPSKPAEHKLELTHEDFASAMQELNSLIDVTPDDLARLFDLAVSHAEKSGEHPARIVAGRYYSNGQLGQRWSICQVVDASDVSSKAGGQVIYKTVAGNGAYETGIASVEDFRQWARFEVEPSGGHWVRVENVRRKAQTADTGTVAGLLH